MSITARGTLRRCLVKNDAKTRQCSLLFFTTFSAFTDRGSGFGILIEVSTIRVEGGRRAALQNGRAHACDLKPYLFLLERVKGSVLGLQQA